jgi:hypothetical protein
MNNTPATPGKSNYTPDFVDISGYMGVPNNCCMQVRCGPFSKTITSIALTQIHTPNKPQAVKEVIVTANTPISYLAQQLTEICLGCSNDCKDGNRDEKDYPVGYKDSEFIHNDDTFITSGITSFVNYQTKK